MARILIIEDEELVRSTLSQYLETAGHEVLMAEDGEKGLQVYQAQQPQLVLSDVNMPTKEGISTLVELRRLDPAVKIIMMSGGGRSGSADYLDIAQQLGAAGILRKPFRRGALLEMVKKVLAG
jgi:DNA-binding response OmpR family regulator